jgi:hypothetical protein
MMIVVMNNTSGHLLTVHNKMENKKHYREGTVKK